MIFLSTGLCEREIKFGVRFDNVSGKSIYHSVEIFTVGSFYLRLVDTAATILGTPVNHVVEGLEVWRVPLEFKFVAGRTAAIAIIAAVTAEYAEYVAVLFLFGFLCGTFGM